MYRYEWILYIPLCLYFFNVCNAPVIRLATFFTFHYVSILIFVKLAASVACPVFTFHYVSILMNEYDLKATGFSTFTFHYVSILIWLLQQSQLLTFKTLHSIMSLF